VSIPFLEQSIELIQIGDLKPIDDSVHPSHPIDVDFVILTPIAGINLVEESETFDHIQTPATLTMVYQAHHIHDHKVLQEGSC